MSNKDIAIGAGSMLVPITAPTLKKPVYLITLLKKSGKTEEVQRIISLDKPQITNGFIEIKGFYCEKDEEEITRTFHSIIERLPKEEIKEKMIPIHRIDDITSLVFSAVKNTNSK